MKIVLLLVWRFLYSCAYYILIVALLQHFGKFIFVLGIFSLVSKLLAPLVGWFADVKFGRYEMIKFGTLILSVPAILTFITQYTEGVTREVIEAAAMAIVITCTTCTFVAMLPFLTDQLIGATSDELSMVVYWYLWANSLGKGLSCIFLGSKQRIVYIIAAVIAIIPLALIIISDCLCQQWLDRTHKVTNPIKLIIQVLNYTRKHKYPERRSAFTYLDEEQPSRMDFGKEKFGGPFTEEEVEDVKTVLRLIPIVACLSVSVENVPPVHVGMFEENEFISTVLNQGLVEGIWLFVVLIIPLYRIIHLFIGKYIPSMLKCAGIGLFLQLLGYVLMEASAIKGETSSVDPQRYLSCVPLDKVNGSFQQIPGDNVEWYWKIGPLILYGVGQAIVNIIIYEFIIAQSPDKMKGFVIGLKLVFAACAPNFYLSFFSLNLKFTLCLDLTVCVTLAVLFAVFLFLSKCYTLRERNREINIQAIVEEHYERYMDQEEEYEREHGNESDSSSDSDTAISDSD